LRLAQLHKDEIAQAELLNVLGTTLHLSGKNSLALRTLQKSRHLAEANSQLGLVAQVLKTEAALYSQVGKMDEALVAITHSLTLARAIG